MINIIYDNILQNNKKFKLINLKYTLLRKKNIS